MDLNKLPFLLKDQATNLFFTTQGQQHENREGATKDESASFI